MYPGGVVDCTKLEVRGLSEGQATHRYARMSSAAAALRLASHRPVAGVHDSLCAGNRHVWGLRQPRLAPGCAPAAPSDRRAHGGSQGNLFRRARPSHIWRSGSIASHPPLLHPTPHFVIAGLGLRVPQRVQVRIYSTSSIGNSTNATVLEATGSAGGAAAASMDPTASDQPQQLFPAPSFMSQQAHTEAASGLFTVTTRAPTVGLSVVEARGLALLVLRPAADALLRLPARCLPLVVKERDQSGSHLLTILVCLQMLVDGVRSDNSPFLLTVLPVECAVRGQQADMEGRCFCVDPCAPTAYPSDPMSTHYHMPHPQKKTSTLKRPAPVSTG